MFKVIFVEKDSRNEIGSPTVAGVPAGTTLHDAKNIFSNAFSAKNPSMQGRVVDGVEWEGISITRDEQLNVVQHREKIVLLIQ